MRLCVVLMACGAIAACGRAVEPDSPAPSQPTVQRAVIAVPHDAPDPAHVDRVDFRVEIAPSPLDFSTCRSVPVNEQRRAIVVVGDGSGAPRTASVLIAGEREVINYSDTRGAFQSTVVDGRIVPPSGRVTAISINLEDDLGVAANEGGGQANVRHVGTAAEFLVDVGFDTPEARIADILRECQP